MKGCYYLRKYGGLSYAPFANCPKPHKNHRPKDSPKCGAKTRKGTPCQAPPVWDKVHDRPRNGRCKLHGGLSTGPKRKREAQNRPPDRPGSTRDEAMEKLLQETATSEQALMELLYSIPAYRG